MAQGFDKKVYEIHADLSIRETTLRNHLCDHWAARALKLTGAADSVKALDRMLDTMELTKCDRLRRKLSAKGFRCGGPEIAFSEIKANERVEELKELGYGTLPGKPRRCDYHLNGDMRPTLTDTKPLSEVYGVGPNELEGWDQ